MKCQNARTARALISLITLELVSVTKSAISPVKMGFIRY